VAIQVPELGLDDAPVSLCLWLVRRGAVLSAGEPVVELLAGAAVVELTAPCGGVLAEKLVGEDEPVTTGHVLGWIDRTV
jgi:pyruvate/2-oxoglutarate dehydrogenase complex dihydrolipoamide acyltransferase (E2) component